MSREEGKTMTSLTLEDLEAMRRHYGIAQEEDLQGDLGQVGVLGEVGMGLERWARLRGLPMEYALALGEYPDQEEGEEEANRGGPESSSPNDLFARLSRREILRTSPVPNSRKSIYNILHMRPPYVGGETRYPRTDTENRSPCLVALDRDAPPRIRGGEGRAV
jgi:hypothetical protein